MSAEPSMAGGQADGSANGASNKRKRDSMDSGIGQQDSQRLTRASHGMNSNGNIQQGLHAPPFSSYSNLTHDSLGGPTGYETHGLPNTSPELSQIDQQILQHVGPQNGVSDENALTAKAALAAHTPQSKYPPPPEASFDSNPSLTHGLSFGEEVTQNAMTPVHNHASTAAAVYAAREATNINQKPVVGSTEWHNTRKNNHKEVERRRRETINEGINELARIVPNCEKNKGSILQRAIQYIAELHNDKKNLATRWDQSNMTTNQAITEISTQNSKLKVEVNRRGDIAAKWIQRCRDAGLEFDDYDDEKDLGQIALGEHEQQ
ncbi:basic helix-loop-helix protein [Arachnomyces sp. PD_36]|nr:basic helix-loop-helix protein [Arachnomyces sp. PD_36]